LVAIKRRSDRNLDALPWLWVLTRVAGSGKIKHLHLGRLSVEGRDVVIQASEIRKEGR
jgi:hypothetical protein